MSSAFSLRTKNMLAFLCIAFITAVVGVTGFMGMKKLESKFNVVIESAPLIQVATNMNLTVSQDLMVIMKLMAALDTEELAVTWKEHEVLVEQFEHYTNAILKGGTLKGATIFPAKDKELIKILKESADFHSKNFKPSFKIIFDQTNKKLSAESYDYNLLDTIDETTIDIGRQLGKELDKVVKISQTLINQAKIEAGKTKTMAVKITTIATIAGILFAIILGYVFSNIVTRPVIKAVQFTQTVSDGDFTKTLDIVQQDEIGTMAKAINKMVESLATIFKDMAKGIITLTQTSSELSDVSQELKNHAKEMSDKSNTVTQMAKKMNERLSFVAASSNESSANLNTVSAAMEEMNATVNEIAKNTGNARSVTQTAVKKSLSASNKVNELGTDANEIGQVTDVIGEISEQTNLLALNATIEAARAGEAGKGFAVVANEIKALANQTADAAKNIKEKIDRIQSSTQGTVTEIEEISNVINDVESIVSSIAGAVEEQSITSREIAQNIAQAAQGILSTNEHLEEASTASENILADISIVNENSTLVANSSQRVADNALKLNDFSGSLKDSVAKFKV